MSKQPKYANDGKKTSARWGILKRMVLERADGVRYLDRIRLIQTPWFGVYLHRFDGPDPGADLHDHPWPFVTMVLSGGYTEVRADSRDVVGTNRAERVKRFRPKLMRLTECHTICALEKVGTRTLVLAGRRSRNWGFYVPGYLSSGSGQRVTMYVTHEDYNGLNRRELTTQYDDGKVSRYG